MTTPNDKSSSALGFLATVLAVTAAVVGLARVFAPPAKECAPCPDCKPCPAPQPKDDTEKDKPKPKRPRLIGDEGPMAHAAPATRPPVYRDLVEWANETMHRDIRQREDDADLMLRQRPPRVAWWLTPDGLLDPMTDRVYAYPASVRQSLRGL